MLCGNLKGAQAMKTDYDIIITGSGSRSGVLWHHFALSGRSNVVKTLKCCAFTRAK
jgi:hypothetical protein